MNILFKEAFDQIQIDPIELRLLSISQFGFARHKVLPFRADQSLLVLGEDPLGRSHSIVFTMAKIISTHH